MNNIMMVRCSFVGHWGRTRPFQIKALTLISFHYIHGSEERIQGDKQRSSIERDKFQSSFSSILQSISKYWHVLLELYGIVNHDERIRVICLCDF